MRCGAGSRARTSGDCRSPRIHCPSRASRPGQGTWPPPRPTGRSPSIAENIRLSFVGLLGIENRKLIKTMNLEAYVIEYGYVDHLQAIQKLMMSDVLWIMVGNGKSASTVSSGKLYEYFGTKKTIIACLPEGSLKTAASEYKAAFITEPDNIEQIKNTIIQVYNLYKEGKLPVPDEKFVESFRRDLLTEQLAKQMNKVLRV